MRKHKQKFQFVSMRCRRQTSRGESMFEILSARIIRNLHCMNVWVFLWLLFFAPEHTETNFGMISSLASRALSIILVWNRLKGHKDDNKSRSCGQRDSTVRRQYHRIVIDFLGRYSPEEYVFKLLTGRISQHKIQFALFQFTSQLRCEATDSGCV